MAVNVSEVEVLKRSTSFRPETVEMSSGWTFRIYKKEETDPKRKQVFDTYATMHQRQCVEYVKNRFDYWCKFNKFQATILEVLDQLNNMVDESDPDTSLPNIVHAFQTAEEIRKEHPHLDWFHLTGLIHDLGKIMFLYGEPQWSTVGDIFPVGCKFAPSNVFSDTFRGNPDSHNPEFNTKYGIYLPNCGLRNVMMSWGHDEYMYQVLQHNGTTLPQEALYIIRYHSFHPWHAKGDYKYLTDDTDEEMLSWVKEFSKFDIYTKRGEIPDIEKLLPYYQSLVDKYIPGKLWW